MASLKRCSGFIELSRLGNFLITPRKITRNSQPPRRVREILWASSTGIHHQFQFSFTHVDNICHANCRVYLAPSEKFPGSANVHRELHAPLRQPLRNLWNSVLGTAADLSRTLSLLPLSFKEKLHFERDERRTLLSSYNFHGESIRVRCTVATKNICALVHIKLRNKFRNNSTESLLESSRRVH